jgi:hypothetical protein
VTERKNDGVDRALCYRISDFLERVMRKASLKAHIRSDKGSVTSNQEGPMLSTSWTLDEQKA